MSLSGDHDITALNSLQCEHDTDGTNTDHGQEAISEDREDAVGIDTRLGHKVEENVDGDGPEKADAVDVVELRLARLKTSSGCHCDWKEKWRHTKSRKVAKPKQNMRGPARSASSMMRSSTRPRGFRTAIDFARMWAKLIPNSVVDYTRVQYLPQAERSLRRTFQQWRLALKPAGTESGPPPALRLDRSAVGRAHGVCRHGSLSANAAFEA